MNRKKIILFCVALGLIGGTTLGINVLKKHQRLGLPGIKTTPIANSPRQLIYLPEQVLDYKSELVPTDTNVMGGLPPDTSFMQRRYSSPSDPIMLMNVVMMGTDRTSIHKPQFCLTGSGWNIDTAASSEEKIHLDQPLPYELPVMKLVSSREVNYQGVNHTFRGIFVYWFVADHDLTADHLTRMRRSATHLITTGELERWAYVACFTYCEPGHEDETYNRMKKFIVAAVPQFQLAPGGQQIGSKQDAQLSANK